MPKRRNDTVLKLTPSCENCGSQEFHKDDLAITCAGCGSWKPIYKGDEELVAAAKGETAPSPLSAREQEVLQGLWAGKTYVEMANDMQLSSSTVRTHVHNLYAKMDVPGAAQACVAAYRAGWLA